VIFSFKEFSVSLQPDKTRPAMRRSGALGAVVLIASVGGIELLQMARATLLDLCPALLQLGMREVIRHRRSGGRKSGCPSTEPWNIGGSLVRAARSIDLTA
jgi:hypothetical protein